MLSEDSDRISREVTTLTWRQIGTVSNTTSLTFLACLVVGAATVRGQQRWEIPQRERHIQIDGFTDEWQGVPWLKLSPSDGDEGFKEGDVELRIQGLWDKENLYLAMHWTDDVWDIERVRRRDAVSLTPDRRRRDRTQARAPGDGDTPWGRAGQSLEETRALPLPAGEPGR